MEIIHLVYSRVMQNTDPIDPLLGLGNDGVLWYIDVKQGVHQPDVCRSVMPFTSY